ncbi:hypothetical protein Glove_9g182 [Diversispora epigaea]|uniref:BTB domain-containing protein n=1 Tax=Diversispora epigaea TaxID=1348612 RepID=A0A397JUZ2_9GLOM|nr:hypothetical protein Glove_9g182 [Diversispora epigaea]
MLAANKFELEELSKKLETILIKEKACLYPNLIFDAGDFISLQESALVSLLKRDDIQMEEVEPYKKILDKQLWKVSPDQPMKSIILPARSVLTPELPTKIKEPFPTIISGEHATEISSWIDHKISTYSSTNCRLIYGHAGFNPLMWDNTTSGVYKETKDNFIFSLRNDYQNKRDSNFGGSALHMHSTAFNFTMDNKSFCSNYDDYNVIIEVEDKKKFTAHSNVLKCRSPYFRKELDTINPNENNVKTIIKPKISAQIFDIILKYIYGGFINLENVEPRIIFDLMLTANEFKFEELSKKLETVLIEDKASWLKSHFSFVYHSIFLNNDFKDLENFCNDIVAKYPNLIFDSDDFTSLQESALVSLLKRDDIQMEEGKIWKYTIKWGISQNPTLPTNLEEWNKENFLNLKITLQQCLPYIRFFHISGDDILDKVKPYKKILDKQLWEDLMQQFISSDRPIKSVILPARSVLIPELPIRVKEPFSTIISDEHAAEISSWIDRKTTAYPSTNYPYEFQLILRGSKDGFSPLTFWNMCHGHTGTVVIIKVKGTDEILGGYNPLMWDNITSGVYKETNDSFIFSLKNGNIQNSILSRVTSPDRALYYYGKSRQNSYGPNFGSGSIYMYSSVSNFTMTNESYSGYTGYYEKKIRTTNRFSIVDYEVFKVNKKTT